MWDVATVRVASAGRAEQREMASIRCIMTKHLEEIDSKETKRASCTSELQGI